MFSHTQSKIQARIQTLLANLAQEFTVERLSKTPARFNRKKLDWFNRAYIKMLSLEEFAYRSQQLKLDCGYNTAEKLLKQQALDKLQLLKCFYLVDFQTQEILACTNSKSQQIEVNSQTDTVESDSLDTQLINSEKWQATQINATLNRHVYQPICLKQELIGELTAQNYSILEYLLQMARQNLHTDLTTLGQQYNWPGIVDLEAKFMELPYFLDLQTVDADSRSEAKLYYNLLLPLNKLELPMVCNDYQWIDLSTFLASQEFLKFPIWQDFCKTYNLPCCQPNLAILQQYLAWILDKNRVTVLSEVG